MFVDVPRLPPKQYPFYSHPQISDRPTLPPIPSAPRPRQSITTKLSRNQIASFRKASSGSQASSTSSTHHPEPARSHHPRDVTRRNYRVSTSQKRHLASSRSTAEMKGRSSGSGDSTRPTSAYLYSSSSSSASEDDWSKTPIANRRYHYSHTDVLAGGGRDGKATTEESPNGSVDPERLVTPSPRARARALGSETPTSKQPGMIKKRLTPGSGGYRKPVPMLELSPCSTSLESASIYPDSPSSIPVEQTSSRALDELFDEVLRACLNDTEEPWTDEIVTTNDRIEHCLAHNHSSVGSVQTVNSAHGLQYRIPSNETSPSPTPTSSRAGQRQRPMFAEKVTQFIPSGRSFEPLRKTNTGPLNISTVFQPGTSSGGEGVKAVRVGNKVKDAVARFERGMVCLIIFDRDPLTCSAEG